LIGFSHAGRKNAILMVFASSGLCREEVMREFVALIQQGPDGGYRVSFPDFPAVVVDGETLERARVRAEYELFCHICRLVAEGETIPEPVGFERIIADPEHQGALENMSVALIEIDDDDVYGKDT
jgi:predicted RNase H-like HicB family nuclease